ncbi:hypothetical protein HOG48_03775 [Candidatus Peregrinibacteria bacterium]|jgi:hypothetical protein|nr:hypothetical protein [Candidatus Peregrinibacteria bacterium]
MNENSENKIKKTITFFILVLLVLVLIFVYARIQTPNYETISDIELELTVDTEDLESMEAALPEEPIIDMLKEDRVKVSAKLKIGDKKYKVKIRYRGDLATHWRYEKKSIGIEFVDDSPFSFDEFALIIPEDRNYYAELFSMKTAAQFSLKTPKNALIPLIVNGEAPKLYFMTETYKEPFFIKNKIAYPTDVYDGDVNLYKRTKEHEGKELELYDLFMELFISPAYFTKKADDPVLPEDDYSRIYNFWKVMNASVPGAEEIFAIFDRENLLKINAFNALQFSTHLDRFHNWKFYFDKQKDRFVFLPWDTTDDIKKDIKTYSDFHYDINLWNKLFYILNQDEQYNRDMRNLLNNYLDKYYKNDLNYLEKLTQDFKEQYKLEVDKGTAFALSSHFEAMNIAYRKAYDLNRDYSLDRSFPGSQISLEEFQEKYSQLTHEDGNNFEISGSKTFEEDLIIPENIQVNVLPGSTLYLGEEVSIISHGKLDFLGGANIKPAKAATPWGVILYVGEGARGSQIKDFAMTGGGDAKFDYFGYQSGGLRTFYTEIDVSNVEMTNLIHNDAPLDIRSVVSVIELRNRNGEITGFEIIPDIYEPLTISGISYEGGLTQLLDSARQPIEDISSKFMVSRSIYEFTDKADWADGPKVPPSYKFYLNPPVEKLNIEFPEELTVKKISVYE